jgi:hypothetical protein
MAKIILILSILAMGGATFFGIKNRQTLISTKKQTIEINEAIDREYVGSRDTVEELSKVTQALEANGDPEGPQALATESIRTHKISISQIESSISSADSDIAAIQAKSSALQQELNSIGVTPDSLLESKDELEKAIVVANEEAEVTKAEIDLARNVIATNRQAIGSIRDRLAKRRQTIGAGQLTVRVRDVDDEFGFVVLNAGKNSGISGDSQFLILRGGTLIAKVSASTVQNSVTVANVVPGSLAAGAVIMPGDTAIVDAR